MRDDNVSEILINGPHPGIHRAWWAIAAQRCDLSGRGALAAGNPADDRAHRTTTHAGVAHSPIAYAYPDSSRLNAVLKPPALNSPLVCIQRFEPTTTHYIDDLVSNESLATEMLDFLAAAIESPFKISMIISGGTGSGKDKRS